jgi:hypothetical protein
VDLKEALVLRQVHRQLIGASNDIIFQYSFIMSYETLGTFRRGTIPGPYIWMQSHAFCNYTDAESRRALLRNQTLPPDLVGGSHSTLIWDFVN